MSLLLPTKQVVIMFILMIVGWICYQVKFLHEQTVKDLTKVLLYVVDSHFRLLDYYNLG